MPKTLLLADDSQTIQRVVALSFAGHDVLVVPVSDGDEAVEALNRSRPDVVLADIAMPGRSGYELADYMRQSSHLADVPVLLLAGAFEPVDLDRLHAVGARGVLSKPIDPAVIVGRVRELLREAGPASFAPESTTGSDEARHAGDIAAQHDTPNPAPEPPVEPSPVVSDPGAVFADLPLRPSRPAQPAPDLDQYFEELDRAFTDLKATRRSPADSEPTADVESHHAVAAHAEPPAAVPRRAVSLTDAFSALLAAESGFESEDHVSVAEQATSAGPAIDMDALVEQVTSRVLAGMSDRLVRETVTDIIVTTAERLVREEIDRIKQDIE